MLIALHLGAHKTATTYIQNGLEQSRQRLAEVGVAYVPLTEVRSTLTKTLGLGRPGLSAAADRLLGDYRSFKRLIISDENIIGGLKPSRNWGFYPWNRRRLTKLLSRLGAHDLRIYFAMRSYDEFISAIYCEYIRHRPFLDVHSYLRGVNYKAFSWLNIVDTFVNLIGARNVTLWRYEDFPLLQNEVFAGLIGAPPDVVEKPTGRVRESLSTDAVQSLASLHPTGDPDELRSRARLAAAAHPKGPNNPPFSAFDPVTSEALHGHYERDTSRILRDFPEIHFLAPGRHA